MRAALSFASCASSPYQAHEVRGNALDVIKVLIFSFFEI